MPVAISQARWDLMDLLPCAGIQAIQLERRPVIGYAIQNGHRNIESRGELVPKLEVIA